MSGQNAFDVIVIGVGAMGSSACYHLARRGAAVLGLEQFDIPNDLGSSHGAFADDPHGVLRAPGLRPAASPGL